LKFFKQCELAVEVHRIPQRERRGGGDHLTLLSLEPVGEQPLMYIRNTKLDPLLRAPPTWVDMLKI